MKNSYYGLRQNSHTQSSNLVSNPQLSSCEASCCTAAIKVIDSVLCSCHCRFTVFWKCPGLCVSHFIVGHFFSCPRGFMLELPWRQAHLTGRKWRRVGGREGGGVGRERGGRAPAGLTFTDRCNQITCFTRHVHGGRGTEPTGHRRRCCCSSVHSARLRPPARCVAPALSRRTEGVASARCCRVRTPDAVRRFFTVQRRFCEGPAW